MKKLSAIFTLLVALTVSAVAAYFSVVGLAALFAATFIPVVIMGTSLEIGKLVAVQWLHMNWSNSNVNWIHRTYKTLAIAALMIITSIGIYGFLSKGHLEQEAPLEGIELQIGQREQQIKVLQDNNASLQTKLTQLDKSIDSFLSKDKAAQGLKARNSQKAERESIDQKIAANNEQINKLNSEILPLKMSSNEVHAKLGPIKYVAELFGWQDTNSAVRLVIGILMFAFDPFAIVMLISATITFRELEEERQLKQEAPIAQPTPEPSPVALVEQEDTQVDVESPIEPDPLVGDEPEQVDPIAPILHIEHDDEHHEIEDEHEEFIEEDHIIDSPVAPEVNPHDAEYRAALETFVSEHYKQEKVSTASLDVPTTNEKQQLIDLLEKQPGLLDVMIEVISTYKQTELEPQPQTKEVISPEVEQEPTLDPTTKPRSGWL